MASLSEKEKQFFPEKGIKKQEKKFKNGELICHYEGEWDKRNIWRSHPQGVIIRKGNDWFIYTGEKD